MNRFFQAFAARPRPVDSDLLEPTVGTDGDPLRRLLAATVPADLSADQVRATLEGNLWMLAPATFRYFLPAFLTLAAEHYDVLAYFAAELINALTEPTRDDVVQALDRAAGIPAGLGLPTDTLRDLRQQQLEWFDSGKPLATYRARFEGFSPEEEDAILDFLDAIRDAHGDDFPFHEPQIAIDRRRARGV
jgi:hypothetical protein